MRKALAALIALLLAVPASAQQLVSGLSTDVIEINSSFAGTEIVLFGAVETEGFATQEGDDIVVVIRGPRANMTVRRKERVAGIWVNTQQITFEGMPAYYFLASTRPLPDIAQLSLLRRFGLGAENLEALTEVGVAPDEANLFRQAAIRTEKRLGLYWESPTGIEFLSHSLFRARIPIPAAVPPGQYKAEVYLFRGGSIANAQTTPLFIDKTGIERRLFELAHNQSLLYGLLAILFAMVLGWAGYFLFRQRPA
ncbi:MAG: TIGR02186 family protein [Alphaproteobacteria bacterium]